MGPLARRKNGRLVPRMLSLVVYSRRHSAERYGPRTSFVGFIRSSLEHMASISFLSSSVHLIPLDVPLMRCSNSPFSTCLLASDDPFLLNRDVNGFVLAPDARTACGLTPVARIFCGWAAGRQESFFSVDEPRSFQRLVLGTPCTVHQVIRISLYSDRRVAGTRIVCGTSSLSPITSPFGKHAIDV